MGGVTGDIRVALTGDIAAGEILFINDRGCDCVTEWPGDLIWLEVRGIEGGILELWGDIGELCGDNDGDRGELIIVDACEPNGDLTDLGDELADELLDDEEEDFELELERGDDTKGESDEDTDGTGVGESRLITGGLTHPDLLLLAIG